MKTIANILLLCFIFLMAFLAGLVATGYILGSFMFYVALMLIGLIRYAWIYVAEQVALICAILSDKFLNIWPR